MKQHARRRTAFPATPYVLHAILHRYPHVAKSELPSWRGLVTAGMVAEPTTLPSPRAKPAIQCKPKQAKSEVRQKHSSMAPRKHSEADDRLGRKDDVHVKSKDELTADKITAPDRTLVSSNNKEKPHCVNTDNIHQSKKICRKEIDKTDIKLKPEIIEIDDDTPSPKADVVEAMKDIDLNNVDAMIVYESDEDVKTIFDVQMGNADKNADIFRNEENTGNVKNLHEIAGQTKYKIFTDCKIERDIDGDNVMPFEQNEDDSLKPAKANDNNNIDDSEENSTNIVISKVWSERDVQKASFHNNAEIFRNDGSDSTDGDSDPISVGNVDYYSYYYYRRVLAKYLEISDLLDLKLLKRPVVSLQRLDLKSINKSSPSQKPQKTTGPSTEFYEKNKALLKQCKACEVSLARVDGKGRKTRKVKLPDIEKVRKDNRCILTAEVAPLVAEAETLRVIRQYRPARTKRLLNTIDNNQSVLPKIPVLGSSESTAKTHALSSTPCQNSSIDQQLRQHGLINHSDSYLPSQDRNLFQDCQNNLQKDGQIRNLNVAFNSISNLMLETESEQNLHTGPESQDVSTKNMTTKNIETQNWPENMFDTCRVSTVTPIPKPSTMLTPKSAPSPKHSVDPVSKPSALIPNPPIKITKPVLTSKLPVLIPNPPIRLPRPGSTPIPAAPVPLPTLPTLTPKPEPTPEPSSLVPNPPIVILTPELEPALVTPKPKLALKLAVPVPPITFAQIPEPVPIPLPQTLISKPKPALKSFVPVPNLLPLTPKLEPFTPVQYPPEMYTSKLEPTPAPDQPITPKSEPTAEPFAQILISPTMLTPKLEPILEPFASTPSYSTDLDQICSIYSDTYSPTRYIVDVNKLKKKQSIPSKFTPILQTSTLLNPTLNSFLTQSAPIPDTPTSPEVTLKPSRKTCVKKSTKKPCKKKPCKKKPCKKKPCKKKPCKKQPCKKKPIKPFILEFALKRSGDQVILKPLSTKKTKDTVREKGPWRMEHDSFDQTVREKGPWRMEHDSFDQTVREKGPWRMEHNSFDQSVREKGPWRMEHDSFDQTVREKGPWRMEHDSFDQSVREKGPWRMEHDSFDQSELDMDMTFAEAYYHLYREDKSFERSVPLLNLL
ncbi:uncharacterized protein LOC134752657 [Cydia strobilella]|uniref:uncharacterized protein LOC134752657 n=1 Tax=Cydia strobilella TaxID=1100964 RepID=UPI00300584D5